MSQKVANSGSSGSTGQSATTGLSLGSLPTRSYAILGAASQEYSVAYFGFDSEEVMNQFVEKYNNFVVEVDQKRKYSLEVTRALYQPMPSLLKNSESKGGSKLKQAKNMIDTTECGASALESLPDFQHFKRNLGSKKPSLLPLEVQVQLERERKAAEEEASLVSIQ